MEDKTTVIYVNSEQFASAIAQLLYNQNCKVIDSDIIYRFIEKIVDDKSLVENIYQATINLLE